MIRKFFEYFGKKHKAFVYKVGLVPINTFRKDLNFDVYTKFEGGFAYLTSYNCLLLSKTDSFEIGDEVAIIGEESLKQIRTINIIDKSPVIKPKLLKMLKKNGFDYYTVKSDSKRKEKKLNV